MIKHDHLKDVDEKSSIFPIYIYIDLHVLILCLHAFCLDVILHLVFCVQTPTFNKEFGSRSLFPFYVYLVFLCISFYMIPFLDALCLNPCLHAQIQHFFIFEHTSYAIFSHLVHVWLHPLCFPQHVFLHLCAFLVYVWLHHFLCCLYGCNPLFEII